MSAKDERVATSRRGFLRFAGLGSVAGGVALVAGGGEAEAAAPEAGSETGYRETAHVRTFYDSARF